MAHNVPAVYDVFAVAIKETAGFQQPQKCAGEKTHKGRSPTAFFRRPSPLLRAQHIQSCYAQLVLLYIFYSFNFFIKSTKYCSCIFPKFQNIFANTFIILFFTFIFSVNINFVSFSFISMNLPVQLP